jgi:tRNA G18 (ribose-2'-O)-methylase SpoU
MNRLTVEEFHKAEKLPLVVVLDDVRSLHNVGSVFRTADAFRLQAICLCGITAVPDDVKTADGTVIKEASLKASQEIHKTALGAEESVSWQYFKSAEEAVEKLKNDGFIVMAIEQCHGSTMLQDFLPMPGKGYAIVLGNEVKGVHQDVVDQCDGCLEIPQFGTKHSLNVSVTAGIAIWHFVQQMM